MLIVSLFKIKFFKIASKRKISHPGRNSKGRITVPHRKNFLKKVQTSSVVDYEPSLLDVEFLIIKIYKSVLRSTFLGLVYYPTLGVFSQILLGENNFDICSVYRTSLNANALNISSSQEKPNIISNFIGTYPLGVNLFLIERMPGYRNPILRSAGSSCILTTKIVLRDGREFFGVLLPSKVLVYVSFFCRAFLGSASNPYYSQYNHISAGSLYFRNLRSSVRGVAKNPVDHPHGGGEGKTSGGRSSVTPWGFLTKGSKTLKFKKKRARSVFLTKLNKKVVS